ncbi:DUF386 domain-containing protein [Candidatus Poribacteria bacterium]|nr:DUF386 domain-containing protein [Candidatus Poribacteria bacterium]
MILDRLANAVAYFEGRSPFARGFDFIRTFDPSAEDGIYPIDGDSIYAIVTTYDTKPRNEARCEAHRRYADIQTLLDGEELCEWHPLEGLRVSEAYDDARDVLFVEDPPMPATFALCSGLFAVFHPQDAHKPSCDLRGRTTVRKIVVKVRLDG